MQVQRERMIRAMTAALGFLFFCAYIAAKIDFFRRYSQLGPGSYLREHSVYWLVMATIAFIAWLIEKTKRTN